MRSISEILRPYCPQNDKERIDGQDPFPSLEGGELGEGEMKRFFVVTHTGDSSE